MPPGFDNLALLLVACSEPLTMSLGPATTSRSSFRFPIGVVALVVAISVSACGSTSPSVHAAAVVPGGAKVSASAKAPAYCEELIGSSNVLHLSTVVSALLTNPGDTSARDTIEKAAAAFATVARAAPVAERKALNSVAGALRATAKSGQIAGTLANALIAAGSSLQRQCGFPVGS